LLTSVLAGCNSATPTSPTPPGPPVVSPLPSPDTITRINVLGGSWVVQGGNPLQMTARIYTRINPDEFVEDTDHVVWTVEPSGILTVVRGRVTGVGSGTARVTATVGDKSGSWPVRSVPDFSGNWAGNYIMTGCSGAGDPRTCGRLMIDQTNGQRILYPFRLTLSQLQDHVTGTLVEPSPSSGEVVTPVTGFVRDSGSLVLEASVAQFNLEPRRVTNWSSSLNTSSTQMSGGFTKISPSRDPFGFLYTLRTEDEFSDVTRTP
jgi:hypothetical protein